MVLLGGGMLVLGAVFHALENLMLYLLGVGWMGWVSMCVFVIRFRMLFSLSRNCGCVVGFVWLCM